jgi:hypothetical protein
MNTEMNLSDEEEESISCPCCQKEYIKEGEEHQMFKISVKNADLLICNECADDENYVDCDFCGEKHIKDGEEHQKFVMMDGMYVCGGCYADEHQVDEEEEESISCPCCQKEYIKEGEEHQMFKESNLGYGLFCDDCYTAEQIEQTEREEFLCDECGGYDFKLKNKLCEECVVEDKRFNPDGIKMKGDCGFCNVCEKWEPINKFLDGDIIKQPCRYCYSEDDEECVVENIKPNNKKLCNDINCLFC